MSKDTKPSAAKNKTALKWQKAAQTPEVAEICRLISKGLALTPELQQFANKSASEIRRGLAYNGLHFKVLETTQGVVFDTSSCPGGGVPFDILKICERMRAESIRGIDCAPTTAKPKSKWADYKSFYATSVWKRLRYKALLRSNGCCECCGRSAKQEAALNVDHIKSIETHPHLMASLDNLQVMCEDCNIGKGSWDDTDWRYGQMFAQNTP